MAMNLAPSHWLEGFELLAANGSATKQSIAIPLDALDGLSADEANASTGDIRKVLRALLTAVNSAWEGEAAADRPAKWTQQRSSSIDGRTSVVTRVFTHTFRTAASGEEVVAEA